MDEPQTVIEHLEEARRDVERAHKLTLREVQAIERMADVLTWFRETCGPLIEHFAREYKADVEREAGRARV